MRFALYMLVYLALGVVLTCSGHTVTTWNYWAIMGCTVAASIIGALQ